MGSISLNNLPDPEPPIIAQSPPDIVPLTSFNKIIGVFAFAGEIVRFRHVNVAVSGSVCIEL